jgi:folylpolyglutamate synthase/dihydropteroate synthase
VCTRAAHARAAAPEELAAIFNRLSDAPCTAIAPAIAALEYALDRFEGPVVVAGSLYLVGEIRGQIS